ncbi:MAG: fluoride efflux transporter CrcB [Trueperaceae bacterium]|nr:fluoride efflux transporter CrcB [Trueperaceae bacterium]
MTTLGAVGAVAAGGAVGAVLRWAVSVTALRLTGQGAWAGFPIGTVIVNVVGTFALAWLLSADASRGVVSPTVRLFLGTGLLGALTTFSTFGLDAHGLLTHGRPGQGLLYLAGTLILAGVAVLAGWAAGR